MLPSAEDEINSACFHPRPGGGLAYGTSEGRLRVLQQERPSAPRDDEKLDEAMVTGSDSD